MKRISLLFISFLFLHITASVDAQDGPLPTEDLINPRITLPNRVSAGIRIGANIFSPLITHDPTDVYNSSPTGEFVPGFNAGLGATVAITNKISLFADVQLISSTAKYLVESGNFEDEFTEDLSLLSLPAGIKYQAVSGGMKFYPMLGIAFNYLMFSDFSYAYHPYPNESASVESGGFDITFERNRVHFNSVLGFGLQYQVKSLYLGFEITYRHGLRNFIDSDDMQTMQIYYGSSNPFKFQSPGFRIHGIMVNLIIQKTGK